MFCFLRVSFSLLNVTLSASKLSLRDLISESLAEILSFNFVLEDTEAFNKMSDDEKNAFIKENPSYGKIICRCEGITEGEIRAAIRQNPKAMDMDGVKRRTRSGMGRCQGGFCSPYVMRIIAEENNIKMEDVTKNGGASKMLVGRV